MTRHRTGWRPHLDIIVRRWEPAFKGGRYFVIEAQFGDERIEARQLVDALKALQLADVQGVEAQCELRCIAQIERFIEQTRPR